MIFNIFATPGAIRAAADSGAHASLAACCKSKRVQTAADDARVLIISGTNCKLKFSSCLYELLIKTTLLIL